MITPSQPYAPDGSIVGSKRIEEKYLCQVIARERIAVVNIIANSRGIET
jgi:hypothetical protein